MSLTEALPVYQAAPTGPMLRLLRRMLQGPITAVRNPDPTAARRVLLLLGGHETASGTVAGLLARGLIREVPVDTGRSEYVLTPDGKRVAKEG